jgi:hypothetical protein
MAKGEPSIMHPPRRGWEAYDMGQQDNQYAGSML